VHANRHAVLDLDLVMPCNRKLEALVNKSHTRRSHKSADRNRAMGCHKKKKNTPAFELLNSKLHKLKNKNYFHLLITSYFKTIVHIKGI